MSALAHSPGVLLSFVPNKSPAFVVGDLWGRLPSILCISFFASNTRHSQRRVGLGTARSAPS